MHNYSSNRKGNILSANEYSKYKTIRILGQNSETMFKLRTSKPYYNILYMNYLKNIQISERF